MKEGSEQRGGLNWKEGTGKNQGWMRKRRRKEGNGRAGRDKEEEKVTGKERRVSGTKEKGGTRLGRKRRGRDVEVKIRKG